MLVKDWRWKSYLGICHIYKLKSPVSAAKYLSDVFLQKNYSLGEMGHQGFLALLVVDYACFMFVTVGEDAFGEDNVLKLCAGTYPEVWQGKPWVAVRSSQFIYGT